MKKSEFLEELGQRLDGLSEKDRKEYLDYYSEMIDDRIEDGLSEDEAVGAVGTPAAIAEEILYQTPIERFSKKIERKKRKLSAWEIVLLALGSPLWIVLLAAALVVVLSLVASLLVIYFSLWAIAISIWAVGVALVACAAVSIPLLVVYAISGNVAMGLFLLGCGLFGGGLSVFVFIGADYAAKGLCVIVKLTFGLIKRCFVRKEAQA